MKNDFAYNVKPNNCKQLKAFKNIDAIDNNVCMLVLNLSKKFAVLTITGVSKNI